MGKFVLLVGNGFSIDYTKKLGINPSKPLHKFECSDVTYEEFIDKLPDIKGELFEISKSYSNDFEAINKFFIKNQNDMRKDCQLRRFLALSYSSYQILLESYSAHIMDWKWFKWINRNKKNLACTVSFNYDLLLENVLRFSNINYYRTGTSETITKVPVIKPHGSIDFDLHYADNLVIPEQRWNVHTRLNQSSLGLEPIEKSKWLLPRFEADIIPPSQNNYQMGLNWVNAGFETYRKINLDENIDTLIILGHSYSEPDRPEIDIFIENLKKRSNVYIANPSRIPALETKIKESGLLLKETNELGLPW